MTYFLRLHFLLILEKALTCISDEQDVFKMVSRDDNRRACITPYHSKVRIEYTIGREMLEVLGTGVGQIPPKYVVALLSRSSKASRGEALQVEHPVLRR